VKFEFHPDALAEYEEATRHYAACRTNLEFRFISEVERAIQRILDAPDRWSVLEEDIRRCLTHVFPYALLYTVESDYVLIVAVMHSHREPGYWRARLD
jgi:plasmid stabilization system protein ParE